MKLSRYCLKYSDPGEAGSLVLYSTTKASAIRIPASMHEDIENGRVTGEEEATLKELGFLADHDERTAMIGFVDEMNRINTTLDVMVALNLDCNLACVYCFEGDRKGKHYLSRDTADSVLRFIAENLDGRDTLRLTLYGGEPLLSMNIISTLCDGARAVADEKEAAFRANIVTNGTLLTRSKAEKLSALGVRSASITLDGPEKTHDACRPFLGGKGSFEIIVQNIMSACDVLDIQLGGNFTLDNYREFPMLLDELLSRGLTHKDISSVKFDPVIKERAGTAPADFHGGCETINEPWLFEASVYLREEIMRRGFSTWKIRPTICMMNMKGSMVIGHDGSLYTCPGVIGREEFKAGSVHEGRRAYGDTHHLGLWKCEECLDCAYLPLCFGGCKYMYYVKHGDMNGLDCRRDYFDATLKEMVFQGLKYGNVIAS